MSAKPAGPRKGDRYVWTTTDGATVLVEVARVYRAGWISLRCHHAGRVWTRKHQGPLFESMRPHAWTTADLIDQLPTPAPFRGDT